MISRGLAPAFVAYVAPVAVAACEPSVATPSDVFTAGPSCAMSRAVDETRSVALLPANDAGDGIVFQMVFDGNACAWQEKLIVYDCNSGNGVVIGTDYRNLMAELEVTGIDRMIGRMAGGGQTLAAIAARAPAEGYGPAISLPAGARISVNGIVMPTDCACALLYGDDATNTTTGVPQ